MVKNKISQNALRMKTTTLNERKIFVENLYSQFKPILKYCIVGVVGTGVDVFSLYIFIEYERLPLIAATTIAFLLAVINNFILNKIWTFQSESNNIRKLFIKFLIVSCVGLLLTNVSMYLQVEILEIWYIYAKFITSGIVLVWNFLANKYWTFSLKPWTIYIPKKFLYELSIVIPALNEEKRIVMTLRKIDEYLRRKKINAEILVVNDGSTDRTEKVVKDLQKKIPNLYCINLLKNYGKGYAVKKGVEAAWGKYILMTDADNSTPIEECDHLFAAMKDGADIAIGSRYMKNSHIKIRQPVMRFIIGRLGNLCIRWFLIHDIQDTQCGFKLFKHEIAKEIFSRQKVHRFGFDMEVVAIAQSLNFTVREIPVSWYNSS